MLISTTTKNKNVTLSLFLFPNHFFPQMTLNFNKAYVAVATTLRFCSCDLYCNAMEYCSFFSFDLPGVHQFNESFYKIH